MMHPVYEISNMPDIQRQRKHYKLKARHRLAFKKGTGNLKKGPGNQVHVVKSTFNNHQHPAKEGV